MTARIAAVLILAVSCSRSAPKPKPSTATAPPATRAAPSFDHAPLSQDELPTTSGEIALGSLSGQIEALSRQLAATPTHPGLRASLISLKLGHAQMVGRLAELDEAQALADELVRLAPKEGRSLQLRAELHATFHRFPDALRDLEAAEKLGVPAAELENTRAVILEALGREPEALALRRAIRDREPSVASLGALAGLEGARGEIALAEKLFTEAQRYVKDLSPFRLAWLYFRHGLFAERAGMNKGALQLYRAAVDRLPAFAPAVSHLAAAEAREGDEEKAIALLRPLVARSDDPEHQGQLAALLERRRPEEAKSLREAAARRYEDLLARHPEAFADHAARFYLDVARQPDRALLLAERNLASRKTRDAYQLVMKAALGAQHPERACAAARDALALERVTDSLRLAAFEAFKACGDQAGAEAVTAALAKP